MRRRLSTTPNTKRTKQLKQTFKARTLKGKKHRDREFVVDLEKIQISPNETVDVMKNLKTLEEVSVLLQVSVHIPCLDLWFRLKVNLHHTILPN